jgi:hypothetical protein
MNLARIGENALVLMILFAFFYIIFQGIKGKRINFQKLKELFGGKK